MIRNDFVSNSSSSSFIVSEEDNKFDIVFNDYTVYDIKQYLDHFLLRDIFGYEDITRCEISYITQQRFSKLFLINIQRKLPQSCKKFVDDIKVIRENKPQNAAWNSEEIKEYYKKIKTLEQLIKDECYNCLKDDYSDLVLHYAEVDDTWCEKFDENQCDLIQEKIEYLNSLKPFKFYRYFSNH